MWATAVGCVSLPLVACDDDAGDQRRGNNDVCGSLRRWFCKAGTTSFSGGSLCKWVYKATSNPSGNGSLCKKVVNNFWQRNRSIGLLANTSLLVYCL
ncbi:L-fucose:H+ symporter permease [Sesbania bispinosa]|nr:L-fucose:H+ symporter permease [Sesbania bispinosa]